MSCPQNQGNSPQSGKGAEVAKVSDLAKIMKRGILVTPALAIGGKVKVSGRVPKAEEIVRMTG